MPGFDNAARNPSLSPRTHLPNSTDHFVEFYESDPELIETVGRFLSFGLAKGDVAIIVADEAHRRAVEGSLARRDVDLGTAREQERLISMDSAETLERFMSGGVPDAANFEKIFGVLIDDATAAGRDVRIFGGMVAELWSQSNVTGALRLEDLWNELARSRAFRLYCAYPAAAFKDGSMKPLDAVCYRHTHVLAAEGSRF